MRASTGVSAPGARDEILGAWLARIAEAADPQPLLQEFAAQYPDWAGELRELVKFDQQAAHAQGPATDDSPRLRQGQRLGPFQIVRRIASGGMGEIYEAIQVGLDRHVAVKVIRQGKASPEARQRFEREQKVLAKLHQSHIVPIYTAGVEENLQYFAMPFISGMALHDLIARLRAGAVGTVAPTVPTIRELIAASLHGAAPNGIDPPAPPEIHKAPATPRVNAASTAVPGPVASAPLPSAALRFSDAYFRSVAEAMAQAADAVQRAHDQGIIHRDIKPSNLMVDGEGHCWIIDFGLAGLEGDHVAAQGADSAMPAQPQLSYSHGALGTLRYMAPEQHRGRAEPRSDIWGLGATLYELLTLRPAFDGATVPDIERQITSADPARPRRVNPAVPPDLEAIALKALRKPAAARYATPADLAADLRCWLNHFPTSARQGRPWRNLLLWLRRNGKWFAPLMLALVVAVAGIIGVLAVQLRAAERREHVQQRERLLLELQRVLLTQRRNRWSDDARTLVRQAARINPEGVQPHASAMLVGLDATRFKSWRGFRASDVAVDQTGRRLVFGGSENEPATIRAVDGSSAIESMHRGGGPVIFRPDGTAVQLLGPTPKRATVLVWNIEAQTAVAEYPVPGHLQLKATSLVLAASGSHIAAAFPAIDAKLGQATVLVWDLKKPKPIREIAFSATCLALNPNGSLLGAGDDGGRIMVWSLPGGPAVPALPGNMMQVRCLAFGHSPRPKANGGATWWLAAGYAGGHAKVWDIEAAACVANILPAGLAGVYDRDTIAFSPTGGLLAVAGRLAPQLYDVFTGRLVLELAHPDTSDFLTGLAFTPDGQYLAASTWDATAKSAGGDLWRLEPGRGTITLRGFTTPISRIQHSLGCPRLVAVSHDWQVGLWDKETGKLVHIWDGPHGTWQDNVGLAVSSDGRRVACSAGRQARLWDAESGRLLGAFQLPPGREDALAFHADGGLYLVRCELRDGGDFPVPALPPRKHPRVIHVRNLLGAKPLQPVRTIDLDDWEIHLIRSAPDAAYTVVSLHKSRPTRAQRLFVFDGANQKPPVTLAEHEGLLHDASFKMDPDGKVFGYIPPGNEIGPPRFLEMPARKVLPLDAKLGIPAPRFERWIITQSDPPYVSVLYELNHSAPAAHLSLYAAHSITGFSPDGLSFAWSTTDHQIIVAQLQRIREELAKDGLGW